MADPMTLIDQSEGSSSNDIDIIESFHSMVAKHHATEEFRRKSPHVQETRTVLVIEPKHLPNSLLGSTLASTDTIAKPCVLLDDDAGSLLSFYRLGSKLAGHVGMVHGGIAAVILDECMGRACFARLPGKIAVTAKLELAYLSPIPVNSVIMVHAETANIQGRKAWVKAVIQDASDGRELVKAEALYIQPRWAADMSRVV